MAEIFGAVASGAGLVSLSLELLQSAKRLRRLYNQARGAPKTLASVVDDLETLSLVLKELESHQQYECQGSLALDRCLLKCRKSTQKIQELVDVLETRIQRSQVLGRLSAAFKEYTIKELLSELEQAKSSMVLSFQAYSFAQQLRRDEKQAVWLQQAMQEVSLTRTIQERLLVQQSSQHSLLHSVTATTSGADFVNGSQGSLIRSLKLSPYGLKKRNDKRVCYPVRFPMWLTGRVWELAFKHAQCGWDFSIRTYTTRPNDDPIFRLAECGDLYAVQGLFSEGKASILDRDEYGDSPLCIAATYGRVELCRFFLSLSDLSDSSDAKWALESYADCSSHGLNRRAKEMYRLFIEEFGMDVHIDITSVDRLDLIFLAYCPDVESIEVIQRNQALPYLSRSANERFEIALLVLEHVHTASPSAILHWAGIRAVNREFAEFKTPSMSALHGVAKMLMNSLRRNDDSRSMEWMLIAVDLLRNGADPLLTVGSGTPLMMLLHEVYFEQSKSLQLLFTAVRLWAKVLCEADIELEEYASVECRLWDQWPHRTVRPGDEYVLDRPILASPPGKCSVMMRRVEHLEVFEWQSPPGSWPMNESLLPRTILWEPDESEIEEGYWKRTSCKKLFSESFDVREFLDGRGAVSDSRRSQDDCEAPLERMGNPVKKQKPCRRRHSQPPPNRKKQVACNDFDYRELYEYRRLQGLLKAPLSSVRP